MQIHGHDIGVCSWSLKPKDLGDLFTKVRRLNLEHVQLAVGDFVSADEQRRAELISAVRKSGLTTTATMINFDGEDYTTIASIRRSGGYVPDDKWEARKAQTIEAAKITKELGVTRISTHVGFIPMSSDPMYRVMVERVGGIATELDDLGIVLLMETGLEPASELLQFLNDLPTRNVGVNFDPANMILYGAGDPIDAIRTLGRHIMHVHVKDARSSEHPGTQWGEEVPFGAGEVPAAEFHEALHEIEYAGPLVIEREAGEDRMTDVRTAIEALSRITSE
jgi:sugar phosphate isomerase/epimerase